MGNILYFDAFNGVAGDMVLGALIDLGLPLEHLEAELGKLELTGYRLQTKRVQRQGLSGVDFRVQLAEDPSSDRPVHDQDHRHHQHSHQEHRTYPDIRSLIEQSRLSEAVKTRSLRIFKVLAEAEAKVHRNRVEQVHFHEVGAVDSIVDVVGACIGFEYFEVEEFYASPLALGGGTVTFSHGTWPVPAPATVELVADFPTRLGPVDSELTTPTGAAIVTALAAASGRPAVFESIRSGLGAGDREFPEIPNMLRLLLGSRRSDSAIQNAGALPVERDEVWVLQANVDDLDSETIGYFMEAAFSEGALDVFYSPVQMKKDRPAWLLSVICRPEDGERFARLFFEETTTLGVRIAQTPRWKLSRRVTTVETPWGAARVKVGTLGERNVTVSPEFEDLRELAQKSGRPLKEIRRAVLQKFGEENKG